MPKSSRPIFRKIQSNNYQQQIISLPANLPSAAEETFLHCVLSLVAWFRNKLSRASLKNTNRSVHHSI